MNLNMQLARIIRWSYYLLFALVPLLLTPWNYELFEYNKMMAVYGLVTIITTAWLVKMVQEKEIRIARTPLDIPIVLFVVSQLISSIFSIDPHVSWFGYYSRFNGGMWSIISYVLLYYAFVTNFQKKITPFLRVALASASVVTLYGIAERLGIDKHLWVQDVQNRVFSTLGQPNWLAAYLVALIPITMALGITKIPYLLLSLLFFIVLLFTRSRSGFVSFAVTDIIFWLLLFIRTKEKTTLRMPLLVIHALLALTIFVNGSNITQIDKFFSLRGLLASPVPPPTQSGPLLEVGGTESGTIRKYVWLGAINAWKSSVKTMMIGTGTETFAFAFYQHRPVEHNQTSEWDFLYNKAHNEYLNFLATTGVFGVGSYFLFIGFFVWWFIKHAERKNTLTLALFTGWLSILVTNFFGFSVVIVQVFLFLFPAMIIVSFDHHTSWIVKKLKLPSWGMWIIIMGGTLTLVGTGSLWYADTLYATGYRLARSDQYASANTKLKQAIRLNPLEPTYRDEIANILAALSVSAFEEQNATLSAQLARHALEQNDQAIRISPANVNFWKTRTKIYYSLSTFDPQLNEAAISALERAAALSPNDPKIYYNLAILYGRPGNNEKAIEMLKKTMSLKPNYRDAYYGLYVFYMEMKKPVEARSVLSGYLTNVDPNDTNFHEILEKSTP